MKKIVSLIVAAALVLAALSLAGCEKAEGPVIGVPNDTTNEARALLLLEAQGILTLKEGAGITATARDIEKNPYNVTIK